MATTTVSIHPPAPTAVEKPETEIASKGVPATSTKLETGKETAAVPADAAASDPAAAGDSVGIKVETAAAPAQKRKGKNKGGNGPGPGAAKSGTTGRAKVCLFIRLSYHGHRATQAEPNICFERISMNWWSGWNHDMLTWRR